MTRLKKAGIRSAAMLTLLTGVSGGLYLADNKADQEAASAEALFAEQELTEASVNGWSQHNVLERKVKAEQEAAIAAAAAAEEARKKAASTTSRKSRPGVTVKIPASCNEYSGNRAIGCALLLEAGFTLSDMANCLEPLWTKESGWNHTSSNGGSGAYGIPQALPGSKMAAYGDDWKTNPATQVKWGLSYIKSRYGTPCNAWATFQSKGWY
nr:lytic transglycosylase domain-containing protein [Rhizocola hellebori]